MERAIDVAKYMYEIYLKQTGKILDEMKLHKLLYFAQRESIAVSGEPLFKDIFEGWRFGPVCVSVRDKYHYGEFDLTHHYNLSLSSKWIINNIIIKYGELTSWQLSKLSHQEISWLNAREGLSIHDNGGIALKIEDIRKDAQKVRPYDPIWDMYLDEFEDYKEL